MIRVTLRDAAVGSGETAALPPVSTSFVTGAVTLLATEGGTRPTVLSLAASGRMRLDAGSITAVQEGDEDGERTLNPTQLRRAIALIDTPLVADHSPEVSIATVLREELAFVRGSSARVRPWLAKYPGARPFGSLGAPERLELLTELALRRPGVEALVVTSPERHGGEPAEWWRLLREVAARGRDGAGLALLVVTDHATVAHLERLPHPETVGDDALTLFSLNESITP